MELEHRSLEPFEPTIRKVLAVAFAPPLLYPQSAILMLRWAPRQRARRFVEEVIRSYHASLTSGQNGKLPGSWWERGADALGAIQFRDEDP